MSVVALNSKPQEGETVPDFRGGAGLELDLLRTLVAIADTGSFNRAARAVFRTPSAVSMQMKKLEEQVARSLFAKDGRSVILTPDGEALVGYGRRILKLADEAHAAFPRPADRRARSASAHRTIMPASSCRDILARFAASHPNVEVDVFCQSSSELLRAARGEQDRHRAGQLGARPANAGWPFIASRSCGPGFAMAARMKRSPLPLAVSHVGCCWRKQALARARSRRHSLPRRLYEQTLSRPARRRDGRARGRAASALAR